MIKAIQTSYAGCRFRSRLEARWAVFFDTLGLRWEYEIEGFELGSAGRYLPDFKVHGERGSVWVEIKPFEAAGHDTKLKELVRQGGGVGILCEGEPSLRPVVTFDMWEEKEDVCPGTGVFATDKYSPVFYDILGSGREGLVTQRDWVDFDRLQHAVNAARSARFEFGESGPKK